MGGSLFWEYEVWMLWFDSSIDMYALKNNCNLLLYIAYYLLWKTFAVSRLYFLSFWKDFCSYQLLHKA